MSEILVADNHPLVRQFLTEILTKEGYRVLTAEDGLAALDLLERHHPQVLIVDLIMPNIDGSALCRIVRHHPEHRGAFIIVLSAVAAEMPVRASDLGANAYLAKGPFKSMGNGILEILAAAKASGFDTVFEEVQGLENIHAREITRELLYQKTHFEVILSSLDEGILEVTGDGRVVFANRSAAAMLGRSEETILAARLADLLPPESRKTVRERIRKPPSSRAATVIAVQLERREIEMRFYRFREKVKKAIVLLVDVTERRRFQEQLHQAQRLESIGTLAAGVAHDFNNLLTVVQGNSDMMLMDLSPTHPHFPRLQEIERQVQSAKRLTGQLLGYARKGRYEIQSLDLNLLVRNTVETFGRTRKEITVEMDLDSGLEPLEGDAGQLEQLVLNLLLNAGDAMPRGGTLSLQTRTVTDRDMSSAVYRPREGYYACLAVRDTGKGMDEQTLGRIFEPFFTTKEMGRGTGLGLASVYGTVKGHGGYVEVESKQGKGSTFTVYLPVKSNGDPNVQQGEQEADPNKLPVVLLVDDEESVRAVTRDMLRSLSYDVLAAATGEQAIELYTAHRDRIVLVILDIVLPGLGGGDIFRRLKAIDPEIRVLLSSGYSIQGEADSLIREGARGFVQKPFSLARLKDEIRGVLGGEKGTQA